MGLIIKQTSFPRCILLFDKKYQFCVKSPPSPIQKHRLSVWLKVQTLPCAILEVAHADIINPCRRMDLNFTVLGIVINDRAWLYWHYSANVTLVSRHMFTLQEVLERNLFLRSEGPMTRYVWDNVKKYLTTGVYVAVEVAEARTHYLCPKKLWDLLCQAVQIESLRLVINTWKGQLKQHIKSPTFFPKLISTLNLSEGHKLSWNHLLCKVFLNKKLR